MSRGMNMLIRWRRFSIKGTVRTSRGAVDTRLRDAMCCGMRSATSWAIMPPMLTPTTCRSRVGVGVGVGDDDDDDDGGSQPICRSRSIASFAISDVEYRQLGLSLDPMPR